MTTTVGNVLARQYYVLLIFGLMLLCSTPSFSQSNSAQYTLSGTITDATSGEVLTRVTVRVQELPKRGAYTNKSGFYSLTLPEGEYNVSYLYMGYTTQTKKIRLTKNLQQSLQMQPSARSTADVTVTAERKNENVTSTSIGIERVDVQSVKNVPVLLGERDVMKTIQLLPGVKAAGEGNSGISVRGGATDQNLILLDEAPVYNASHLLGFFSTFNSDAIRDITLYKSGMPANYGGRVSSVLDLQMNEGNKKSYHVNASIGLISSKVLVEGPIQEDQSSFLLAARRTYADVFLKLSSDESIRNSSLYFYDLNAKVNVRLGASDRLFLSGYFGRDVLGFNENFGIDWGNGTGTLRYNHEWSEKMISNSSLVYSNYDYNINISLGGSGFEIYSRIRDWNFKHDFEYFFNPENTLNFGVNTIHHSIVPGVITVSGSESGINPTEYATQASLESGLFASHRVTLSDEWKAEYGLRVSAFSILGGTDQYVLDSNRTVIDTVQTANGILKNFVYLEPRINISYILDEDNSIKASYVRNAQGLHLLSTSTTSSPTDRWISSNNNIDPQTSNQWSVGYFHNFSLSSGDNADYYELSVEGYFKTLHKQIDYKDNAEINATQTPETEILVGEGRAYGAEFMIKKKSGDWTGWLSYTLARSERQIPGVNKDAWYPFKYDRTHDVSLVVMYAYSDSWNFSANFVYNSGNAVTLPAAKYMVNNTVLYFYTERNGYRMPDYHRLDLGANWILSKQSEINFSLYNAYGRENAYTIDFRTSTTDKNKTEAVQTSLFRWVPSISYSFRF